MDKVVEKIKEETLKLPLLARAILNITSKTADKNFYFTGNNVKRVNEVAKEFNKILKNSNYNPNLFLKECFQNLVKYSNVFILPYRNNEKKLERIRVVQNIGWTVHERIGTSLCTKFIFKTDDFTDYLKNKEFQNKYNIFHFTYNRENDEIFAMPIWCSVIPTLQKYNFLITNVLQSYADQAITRIIYELGVNKAGQSMRIRPDQHDSAKYLLEHTDDDLILDFPVNINKAEKEFVSPDKVLETLEHQIYAGLFSSKGQLGSGGSGRQEAETQDENTLLITNSFLKELEFQINKSIIDEICINLYGNTQDEIELKFSEGFNIEERKEKHAVFLFQGGVITIDEVRKLCRKDTDFDKNKMFQNFYGTNEMSGTVENVNNPKNQNIPNGTGTTKKTKKD